MFDDVRWLQTLDPNREEHEYRQTLLRKIKKNKHEVRALKAQMTQITDMLSQLLEKHDAKAKRREARRRSSVAASTIPETATASEDEP